MGRIGARCDAVNNRKFAPTKRRGRESIATTIFHVDHAYRNRLPTPLRLYRGKLQDFRSGQSTREFQMLAVYRRRLIRWIHSRFYRIGGQCHGFKESSRPSRLQLCRVLSRRVVVTWLGLRVGEPASPRSAGPYPAGVERGGRRRGSCWLSSGTGFDREATPKGPFSYSSSGRQASVS